MGISVICWLFVASSSLLWIAQVEKSSRGANSSFWRVNMKFPRKSCEFCFVDRINKFEIRSIVDCGGTAYTWHRIIVAFWLFLDLWMFLWRRQWRQGKKNKEIEVLDIGANYLFTLKRHHILSDFGCFRCLIFIFLHAYFLFFAV